MKVPLWGARKKSRQEIDTAKTAEGDDQRLPTYEESTQETLQAVSLRLHPLTSRNALLIQAQPPRCPAEKIHHVPCDIVLVIDISGSMKAPADVPGDDPSESMGFSILDLVKHAVLTIIEGLDDRDRLGMVTYSSRSQTIFDLMPMSDGNKTTARHKIREIKAEDATSLWRGLQHGLKLFNRGSEAGVSKEQDPVQRVPAMMVLTDGRPNFMCPPAGYVPKLREMLPLPATIHTFGFGCDLDSGLLKSIAELGCGNYAFIPDAGMIGTVFTHAVANLQCTFAMNAALELRYPASIGLIESMGDYVGKQTPDLSTTSDRKLTINLGNLQYGHSRDIFLRANAKSSPRNWLGKPAAAPIIAAKLTYKSLDSRPAKDISDRGLSGDRGGISEAQCDFRNETKILDKEIAYHESRALICEFLSSVFPLSGMEIRKPIKPVDYYKKPAELSKLITRLPANDYRNDERNRSLMEDVSGEEPRGQVSLAIKDDNHFRRWGIHYLPSLLNAHYRQVCTSFKDQGPLQYCANSPLFLDCLRRLDDAFENLEPPEPSLWPLQVRLSNEPHGGPLEDRFGAGAGGWVGQIPIRHTPDMSKYHNPSAVCFAGTAMVELSTSKRRNLLPIRQLRRGMKVCTPAGPRSVAAVLKTWVKNETLCRVPGGVLVTPWHPICLKTQAAQGRRPAKDWVFPAHVATGTVTYTGYVYTAMLQRDRDEQAHAIGLGGLWGVTLGHGIVKERRKSNGPGKADHGAQAYSDDIRTHRFFGDYDQAVRALQHLGVRRNGIAVSRGSLRCQDTGMIIGFKRSAFTCR